MVVALQPVVEEEAETTHLEEIDSVIISWVNDWQSKDVNRYLSHYSKDFTPSTGKTLTEWKELRNKRLSTPAFIEIGVCNIKKKMTEPTHVRVTFNQEYKPTSL